MIFVGAYSIRLSPLSRPRLSDEPNVLSRPTQSRLILLPSYWVSWNPGLSRPKALQRQGFDWVLTENYDRVLRELNESRATKGGMGDAASKAIRKWASDISAGF